MIHLKELLVAKNKTQSELAAVLGRDKSAITNLLRGKRQLKAHEVPIIAHFLNVSEAEVLGINPPGMSEPTRVRFQGAPSVEMLRSGQLIEEDDGAFYLDGLDQVSVQCYALEVQDAGLDLAGILPGDIAICDPSRRCENGNIVVVQIYEHHGTAKTVLRKYQPPFLNIESTREGFERLHEDRANVAIIAPVVRMIRIY